MLSTFTNVKKFIGEANRNKKHIETKTAVFKQVVTKDFNFLQGIKVYLKNCDNKPQMVIACAEKARADLALSKISTTVCSCSCIHDL